MKKWLLLLLTPWLVDGCSEWSFGPEPPKMVESSDVTAQFTSHEDMAFKTMTPAQYVATGYNLVYSNCTNYFDALIKLQNQTGFVKDTTIAGGSAAGAILGLAKASSAVIGGLAAGVGFAAATIDSFDKRALVTPYPDETKSLILAALDKFSSDAPADTTSSPGIAIARVQHYAELCTYSGISRFAKQALQAAKLGSDNQQGSILTDADKVSAAGIAGLLKTTQQLSQDQLALLYWYFVDKADADKTKSLAIMKNFPEAIQKLLIDKTGAPTVDEKALSNSVSVLLKTIYQGNKAFQKLVADTEKPENKSVGSPPVGGTPAGAAAVPHIFVIQ